MKRNNCSKFVLIVVFVLSILGVNISTAFAHKMPHPPERHGPYYGHRVSFPEMLVKAIVMGGLEYYYHHGYFYRKVPGGGYIIVDAPVGAVVDTIPPDYKVVVINGKTYYYQNDIYFVKAGRKYRVVSDPVYQVVALPEDVEVIEAPDAGTSLPATQNASSAAAQEAEFTVNILNANGSYTAVKIVRSGNGFVGPQGEFYTEFPKVEQLRVMYGK